jgi:hypothetical protein
VIARFIAEQSDAIIDALDMPMGDKTQYGRQLLPDGSAGDGFYFCRLSKSSAYL